MSEGDAFEVFTPEASVNRWVGFRHPAHQIYSPWVSCARAEGGAAQVGFYDTPAVGDHKGGKRVGFIDEVIDRPQAFHVGVEIDPTVLGHELVAKDVRALGQVAGLLQELGIPALEASSFRYNLVFTLLLPQQRFPRWVMLFPGFPPGEKSWRQGRVSQPDLMEDVRDHQTVRMATIEEPWFKVELPGLLVA